MNSKIDSIMYGIKFYESDGSVLLTFGHIDDPNYRDKVHISINTLTLQKDERLVGVKSSGGRENAGLHFNL